MKKDKIKIKFEFYGWLKEPEYVLELDKEKKGVFQMVYAPKLGKWVITEWLEDFKFDKWLHKLFNQIFHNFIYFDIE